MYLLKHVPFKTCDSCAPTWHLWKKNFLVTVMVLTQQKYDTIFCLDNKIKKKY